MSADIDPGAQPLRVVVLTIGGRYGVLVLEALRKRGLIPTAVMVEANPALRACFHKRTRRGRLAELPLAVLRSFWRRLQPRTRRDLRIGAPVAVTGPLNSERMRRDLQRLRPDLLVLGGTGIVSAELLAIPRLGTLNVHIALLPWVRGNDVIAHSILDGIALGATCHVVDPGIDTGPVLRRRLLDVSRVEPSLFALETASVTAGAQLMTDVVAEIVRDGSLPTATAQTGRFPLHRFLDATRRVEADSLIRSGRAGELFETWSRLAIKGSRDLPAGVAAAPETQRSSQATTTPRSAN